MPRYEYEMVYPVNGMNTLRGNTIKQLSEKSGYSVDVIYNKLKKDCSKTDILYVKRIITEESIKKDKEREGKEKKIIDKNREKIRSNKKYHFNVESNGVITECDKLRIGAEVLKISPSFMFKILNNEKFREQYKVTIINDN